MKLLTAYKSVSSSCDEEAVSELNQFVMHHSVAFRKPTHYRVYGRKALDAVRAFLEAAGAASAFSVEASALDPEAFRIQWKDPAARATLVTQISSANPSVVSGAEALGLSDSDEGIPAGSAGTGETPAVEPPDIASATEAASAKDPDMAFNDWTRAILSLHDAFSVLGLPDTNPFVGSGGNSCFRYVTPGETVTPFGAAAVSSPDRTLFADPDIYDGTDVIEGYMGFSVRDAREAVKCASGRPCVAFVASSEILWSVDAFAFCSDRRKLFTAVRDAYERIYGCDGKYRVVIHPASRVTVDNKCARLADTSGALGWPDLRGYQDDVHVPVSLCVMGFIVPASMVSDTDPLRTMEEFSAPVPTVRVVRSAAELASEDMYSADRITSSEIPAEWFAMTHLNDRGSRAHFYLANSVRTSNTVGAKATYAALAGNPSSAARACSVSRSPAFSISRDRYSGTPTGSPSGAFVAAVSGALRIAFSKAGATSVPLKAAKFPGKDPNRLHEKGAIATAVYSGVVTDTSKTFRLWLEGDGSDAFPAIPPEPSAEDWTSFIARLPGSGAMFRSAPLTEGSRRSVVIVETNVDYDAFVSATEGKPETRNLVRKAAVMFLAYRYRCPDQVVTDLDPSCETYYVSERLVAELGNKPASDALGGNRPGDISRFSGWTPDKDVVVAFHKDSYGRLYVVVELIGIRMQLVRYVYRCHNGLNVLGAAYVAKHLAGTVAPRGTVLVQRSSGSMTQDEAVRYAIELLRSLAGSVRINGPETDCGRFWTGAYRYGGIVPYGDESSLMTKSWYEQALRASGIGGSVTALLRG